MAVLDTPHRYGDSHAVMGSQCYLPPGRDNIPAFTLSQIKLVLDLATREGCKFELT